MDFSTWLLRNTMSSNSLWESYPCKRLHRGGFPAWRVRWLRGVAGVTGFELLEDSVCCSSSGDILYVVNPRRLLAKDGWANTTTRYCQCVLRPIPLFDFHFPYECRWADGSMTWHNGSKYIEYSHKFVFLQGCFSSKGIISAPSGMLLFQRFSTLCFWLHALFRISHFLTSIGM
jgi:hypothetical protein